MLDRLKSGLAALALTTTLAVPAALADIPPMPPEHTETKPGNPAIWSFEKPAGGTVALFGSVHLLPTSQQWRTAAFEEALAKADVVVFETQIADMQSPELIAYLQQNMMNPPGVTLSTLLSADEKASVEKAAESIGVSFAMLEPMRPWIASLQIAIGFVMKQGFDPNAGVDKLVEAEATAAGKALDYFETGKEQLEIFVTLTPEQEKAFLVTGAQQMLEAPDELTRLVDAWAAGDVAQIDELMNKGLEASPELAKKLLEDRNARWVDKITGTYLNDSKNYLIVVGAGHLAGDKSVQAMLKAKGIEVSGP